MSDNPLPPFVTLNSAGTPYSAIYGQDSEPVTEPSEDPEPELIVNGRMVCPECGDAGGSCSECGRLA